MQTKRVDVVVASVVDKQELFRRAVAMRQCGNQKTAETKRLLMIGSGD
jgi:hypothetical protein